MTVLVETGVRAAAAPSEEPAAGLDLRGRAAAYVELTKPGITRLVSLTAAAGFYMGSRGAVDVWALVHTIVGTALVASGASAFNQYLERVPDARMRRTAARPLPSGRISGREAVVFATLVSLAGLFYLLLLVHAATAIVDALTLVVYAWVYTPLKRITDVSTLVGAVPGALPVLAGWVAAGGSPGDLGGWALFWILFLWQIPHFLALAWMFRDDYRRGGFVMLSMDDPDGRRTAAQSVNYAAGLVLVSVAPALVGLAGNAYLLGSVLLGGALLAVSVVVLRRPTDRDARRLFFASVIYLPLLLVLMVVDKLPR